MEFSDHEHSVTKVHSIERFFCLRMPFSDVSPEASLQVVVTLASKIKRLSLFIQFLSRLLHFLVESEGLFVLFSRQYDFAHKKLLLKNPVFSCRYSNEHWCISMNMIPVTSKAISAIGYDPSTMRMCIRFKQGHTYTFCRVPQPVFDGLLSAASKGTYYDRHIRGRYQC